MNNAEIATFEAKRRRKNVIVHNADCDTHHVDRLNILRELRQTIDANDLIVHYQPQFEARWSDHRC